MSEPTMRVIQADVTVPWDGGELLVKRGALVSITAGSELETACGGPSNTPLASTVQTDAALSGIGGIGQSN